MKDYSLEELKLISEFLREQSDIYFKYKWETFHEASNQGNVSRKVLLETLEKYYDKRQLEYYSAHRDVELLINEKSK